MNEESESILAILGRLEKIEKSLDRVEEEIHAQMARNAAFNVKWEQFIQEEKELQEHIKEQGKRLDILEQKPLLEKAKMWDTFTGRVFLLAGTAIGTALLTHIPEILKLFWR